jgi:hypothetical protein
MPAWRQGVAVGEWRQITGTALSSAPMAVQTYPSLGGTGPQSKVVAWTGFAIDTRDSSIYSAANGGHNDYAGNEVNVIRLSDAAPKWTEPRAATPVSQIVADSTHYADGRPTSRHSYYGEVFNEKRNRVMTLGGSRYGIGNVIGTVDGFNVSTSDWDAAHSYADGPVELAGTAGPGIAEHKATGDIYVFANWNVARWNNATNAWTRAVSGATVYGQYSATAVDTKRNRILVVGGVANDAGIYDIATNTVQKITFSGPNAGSVAGNGNGMVYDPLLDAYLLHTGAAGGTVYRINAQTFAVDVLPNTGGGSLPATQNGVWKRILYVPALKGIVYAPSYGSGLWFMRTY